MLVYRSGGGRGIAWPGNGSAVFSRARRHQRSFAMPLPSRRDVLHCGAAATAGLLASVGPACAADTKATGMTIIDTHQHLWDLSRFRLPWVKEGTILSRSYLVSDYHAAAAGTGVEKT